MFLATCLSKVTPLHSTSTLFDPTHGATHGTEDAQDLCNALARSNLHPPDEVRALLKRFLERGTGDAAAFAGWLKGEGKLSDFQAGLLLRGRWDRLKVDDYVLVDRMGQGRLAGVYEARHRLGQRVAVKILPPSKVADPQVFGRFQRETRLARKLKHPNIVRTFQSGEANGLHYLVMEYLDGETLDDVLNRRKRLPAQEAVRLVHQALLGLQHLHEEGMVHRDLTPANLMLVPGIRPGRPDTTDHATVKLLEIGLGRALFDEGDPKVASTRSDVMQHIIDWVGTRYHYGGLSRDGIDCSAFTREVFRKSFNVDLPRTACMQSVLGNPVHKEALKFGDLVFFHTSGRAKISHVGIYVGEGLFANASCSRGVTVSSLESKYWAKRFLFAKRLFTNTSTAQKDIQSALKLASVAGDLTEEEALIN